MLNQERREAAFWTFTVRVTRNELLNFQVPAH